MTQYLIQQLHDQKPTIICQLSDVPLRGHYQGGLETKEYNNGRVR